MLEQAAEAVGLEAAAIALCAMRRHKAEFGNYPNLLRPRTFNEKVLYRMAFDRRPILITLQDKYAAREYVRERVGDHVLPRLYWVTKNPADIPFDKLPDRFVVKATHGCGFNYLVPDKARVDWADVMAKCASWLKRNYYSDNREWVYEHIEPRIIVEEFIRDGTGPVPTNYKLFTFHGSVRVISVNIASTEGYGCYGRSWNRLPVSVSHMRQIKGEVDRPRHLDEMIRYSEVLAEGLDFIRVDLYDTHDKVYFGEFTTTPHAGVILYSPREFDYYLGGLWSLHPNEGRQGGDVQALFGQRSG